MPTIPVLERILGLLNEQLLIGAERRGPDRETKREHAPALKSITACIGHSDSKRLPMFCQYNVGGRGLLHPA